MDKYTNEALRMQPYLQKGAQTLDDADALAIETVYPEWRVGESYAAGDKVQHDGVLYKCLQDHVAQEGWTPVDAPSLWAKVLIPDPGVIPEWEQPDSTNPYMKGDKVKHNSKTWVSDVDNNVREPGVYGWTEEVE
jgi:chitodextrinase